MYIKDESLTPIKFGGSNPGRLATNRQEVGEKTKNNLNDGMIRHASLVMSSAHCHCCQWNLF